MARLNPTPPVSGRFGAPLGRPTVDGGYTVTANSHLKFRLVRIRLDSGGYDPGGAYWGLGNPLYYFECDLSDIHGYVRGRTRAAAKAAVRDIHPHARFYDGG